MALADEYKKQYKWRDWKTVYSLLPQKKGQVVLDLGCAIGDQSRDLAALGCQVIAIDGSQELITQAQQQESTNITYYHCELSNLSTLSLPQVDGILLSFSAAYFPDLDAQLKKWCQYLRPRGWIAMVEASDIFAHSPMDERAKKILTQYYSQSLTKGHYDFMMGEKLKSYAELAGLDIELAQTLPDRELCFKGPAPSAILDAWKARLNRMQGLQEFCGENYSQFRMRFMACLVDEGHRSQASVHFVVARQSALKII